MVRELEAHGKLQEALLEAEEKTKDEMYDLTTRLMDAGINGAAGPRSGLGNGEGGIHLVDAGRNGVVRNQSNYRISEADGVGEGSIKEKCRANLAAIRLRSQT